MLTGHRQIYKIFKMILIFYGLLVPLLLNKKRESHANPQVYC
jgi:hypothetical protein